MISLIWIFQTVFLDSFYTSIKTKNLTSVASQVENDFDAGQLQETINALSFDHEVCIRVIQLINRDSLPSEVQYLSQGPSACAVARLNDEQVLSYWIKARENGGVHTSEMVEVIPNGPAQNPWTSYKETGNQDIVLAKSAGIDGLDGLILVSTRITPVNSTIETLKVQLVFITGIICVMAIGLAGFMTLKVTRPLEEINESAKILATGNVDVEFKASGYKEIDELNETLNTAAVKLKEVDQLRRDLISNVSHDLRTPLTMIAGYSEMMRDLPGENTPENAQVILDEAHRLSQLVNDLLDLNRLQENKLELNLTTVDISHLMKDLVSRYEKYVESIGMRIACSIEAGLFAAADKQRLEQVLYNFINNALQYSGDATMIEVRASLIQNKVHIEIEDHGIGIASDQLDSIWERYYKIDKEHVRAHAGSGIGLSICKEILKLHHAEFGVRSKENVGTVFWFDLKCVKDLSNEQ